MAWILLFLAGLSETAFALCLKQATTKPTWFLVLLTCAMIAVSIFFLGIAMREIPASVAYPVWVGIGILGTVSVRSLFYGDAFQLLEGLGVVLIIAGIGMLSRGAHP